MRSENYKVYYALLEDQCVNTFQHTQDEIVEWLRGCDDWARKSLLVAIKQQDEHMDKYNANQING